MNSVWVGRKIIFNLSKWWVLDNILMNHNIILPSVLLNMGWIYYTYLTNKFTKKYCLFIFCSDTEVVMEWQLSVDSRSRLLNAVPHWFFYMICFFYSINIAESWKNCINKFLYFVNKIFDFDSVYLFDNAKVRSLKKKL